MTTRLKSLRDWVAQVAQLTSPDRIHWCDGTEQEYRKLVDEMLDNGTLLELNQATYPGCYLHRSDPEDVARVGEEFLASYPDHALHDQARKMTCTALRHLGRDLPPGCPE